nr:MAG TPA: hypothetical protein [Caudoviricetes sp.]
MPTKCIQLRILIKKLPSILFAFVSDLRFSRVNFLSPMFGVWLERRHFIRIVMILSHNSMMLIQLSSIAI